MKKVHMEERNGDTKSTLAQMAEGKNSIYEWNQ